LKQASFYEAAGSEAKIGLSLKPKPNLKKLLGAYLGALLSQVNRVSRLNKRLKAL